MDALPKRPPETGGRTRALFGMDTEGAPALAAAALWPGAEIRWFHLDAYVAAKVERVFSDNFAEGSRPDLRAEAAEDAPAGPFDVAALAFPRGGEALLMRDLVESAHDALRVGGRLVVSTDGGGAALRKVVEQVFGAVTPGPPAPRGAVHFADRRNARSRRRDHSHVLEPEIASAGGGEPVRMRIETRPGTFSHGSFDRGTRALLEWYVPAGDRRVLDLGAGCGAIGIHVALRVPEARVVLVESNLRAAACARRNVERNGVADRCEVLVRKDIEDLPRPDGAETTGFDRCLANPPYFGDFRIARSFVSAAREALRPGGGIALVVRRGAAADAHEQVVREVFGRCTPFDAGDYAILTAVR